MSFKLEVVPTATGVEPTVQNPEELRPTTYEAVANAGNLALELSANQPAERQQAKHEAVEYLSKEFHYFDSENPDQLVKKLREGGELWAVNYNLDKFLAAGADVDKLVGELREGGELGVVAENIDKFLAAGANIDVDKLVGELREGGELGVVAENIDKFLAAGANIDVDKLVGELREGGELGVVAENIDKFLAAGANIDVDKLVGELREGGELGVVAENIDKFLAAGANIDVDKLVGELREGGELRAVAYSLDKFLAAGADVDKLVGELREGGELRAVAYNIDKFLAAGADVDKLVGELREGGELRAVAYNIDKFLAAGADVDKLVGELREGGELRAVAYNIDKFLAAGADVDKLVGELREGGELRAVAYNIDKFLAAGADVDKLVGELRESGELRAVADNIDKFLAAGADVDKLVGELRESGELRAVADNIDKFLAAGADVDKLVGELREGGELRAVADNIDKFLAAGADVDKLVGELRESGKLDAVAYNIDKFLAAGADVDQLVGELREAGQLGAVAENLDKFLAAGAEIDVDKLVSELREAGQLRAVAENLDKFLAAGVEIDVDQLVSELREAGSLWAVDQNLDKFLAAGVDKSLLIKCILKQLDKDDLRDIQSHFKLKNAELGDNSKTALMVYFFESPNIKRFIKELGNSGLPLSMKLFRAVYEPALAGESSPMAVELLGKDLRINKGPGSEQGQEQKQGLGRAQEQEQGQPELKLSPKELYQKCVGKLNRLQQEIISGNLGGLLAESSEPLVEYMIYSLRIKRGEWSMKMSSQQFRDLVREDAAAELGRVHSEQTTWQVELLDDKVAQLEPFKPTANSIEEAKFISSALKRAVEIGDEPIKINQATGQLVELLVAELKDREQRLSTNSKIPDEAKQKQLQELEAKLSVMQDGSGSLRPASLQNIASILEIASSSSSPEIKSLALSVLAIPYVNQNEIPEGTRQLIMLEEEEFGELREEQFESLYEFSQHHMGKEFWLKMLDGKENKVAKNAVKNLLGAKSIQDNLSAYRNKLKALQAASTAPITTEPITVIRTNSKLAQTIAGAMGDACYSKSGNVVPEDNEVCIMLDAEGNVAGSSLILRGESEDNQKLLMLRAVNPLEKTLKKFKVSDLLEATYAATRELAQLEEALPTIVIDDVSNRATTNRPAVLDEVKKRQAQAGSKRVITTDDRLVFNNHGDTLERVYKI